MIVKMSKASFIFLDSEKDEALEKIRGAGVVHLEKTPGTSETLTSLTADRDRVSRALMRLDTKVPKEQVAFSQDKAWEMADRVLELLDRIKEGEEALIRIREDLLWWKPWGNFDPSEVAILKSKGVELRFYETSRAEWDLLSKDSRAFAVNWNKNKVYGVVALAQGDEVPPGECVTLPAYGVAELTKQYGQAEAELKSFHGELQKLSGRREMLETLLRFVEQDVDYHEVRTGLGNEEILDYFTGFLPVRDKEAVQQLAAENGWAVIFSEPREEDAVPTLVENKQPVKIIQPMFQLLEVLPGYKEFDISLDFLIFFGLFFAMIIGDAGYGLIFLVITAAVNIKMKRTPDALKLLYLLSACTVAWGTLTGTWFGSEALAGWAPLKGLVLPTIASYPKIFDPQIDSAETVKYMCFIIGTFQLSVGRIKNFMKRLPSLQAVAQLGWLAMLIGVYHIVLLLVLAIGPIQDYVLYLLAAGMGLVVLFGEQESGVNFFKGVLKGLAGLFTTFLDAIGLLSHIISYIRLFAVGLASLAIASSFNAMAEPLMKGPFLIFGILILLLGHGLNILMGALSLIVHGVRLNMLEYSGHLDMEWAGIKYTPFKKAEL